jgi:hypothetical protein
METLYKNRRHQAEDSFLMKLRPAPIEVSLHPSVLLAPTQKRARLLLMRARFR